MCICIIGNPIADYVSMVVGGFKERREVEEKQSPNLIAKNLISDW